MLLTWTEPTAPAWCDVGRASARQTATKRARRLVKKRPTWRVCLERDSDGTKRCTTSGTLVSANRSGASATKCSGSTASQGSLWRVGATPHPRCVCNPRSLSDHQQSHICGTPPRTRAWSRPHLANAIEQKTSSARVQSGVAFISELLAAPACACVDWLGQRAVSCLVASRRFRCHVPAWP
jgi:hypothetical protein